MSKKKCVTYCKVSIKFWKMDLPMFLNTKYTPKMGRDITKLTGFAKDSKSKSINDKKFDSNYQFIVLSKEEIEKNRIRSYEYAI